MNQIQTGRRSMKQKTKLKVKTPILDFEKIYKKHLNKDGTINRSGLSIMLSNEHKIADKWARYENYHLANRRKRVWTDPQNQYRKDREKELESIGKPTKPRIKNIQITLEKGFSYETRFYCDNCNEEVAEDGQLTHTCNTNEDEEQDYD